MSTSPSWFDKEKFSRLVKKVGTTTRTGGAQSASSLPASNPSVPSTTGPVQLRPASAPPAEEPAPTPSAGETPARAVTSSIPKPTPGLPIFTYKTGAVAAAKAPEPAPELTSEPVPEETPESPPASAPVARVFIAPPPDEVSTPEPEIEEEKKPQFSFEAPKPEPVAREGKKPKFSFEIPKSELPSNPLPPELPTEKAESAADFHVAQPPHLSQKTKLTTTSTLQRLPRIGPAGSKPSAPPTSALARRTTTLPGIKPLTVPLQPMERTEDPIRASATPPPLARAIPKAAATFETWQGLTVLPDETVSFKEQIAHLNQERDNLAAKVAQLTHAAQECDEATFEVTTLRNQLAAAREQNTAALQTNEVIMVTGERDAARRDYTELRKQYEKIKQDQLRLKNEHAASLAELKQQIDAARRQGGSHGQEPAACKDDVIETLKQELKNQQEQVARFKDEASAAQRGLALSQKALHETRDALREASDAKSALENVKKERSNLVQQNMLLQAQNDQIARELSTLKAKTSK